MKHIPLNQEISLKKAKQIQSDFLNGDCIPPIFVDQNEIVAGHHRFVANLLLIQEKHHQLIPIQDINTLPETIQDMLIKTKGFEMWQFHHQQIINYYLASTNLYGCNFKIVDWHINDEKTNKRLDYDLKMDFSSQKEEILKNV